MALPSHLRKYDSLLDLLAEAVVRQIEAEKETPAGMRPSAGVDSSVTMKGSSDQHHTLSDSPTVKRR
jgi:hypothetical protein